MTTRYIVVHVIPDGSKEVVYGNDTIYGQEQIMDSKEVAERVLFNLHMLFHDAVYYIKEIEL